jgi:hypothetical protein
MMKVKTKQGPVLDHSGKKKESRHEFVVDEVESAGLGLLFVLWLLILTTITLFELPLISLYRRLQ